MEKLKLKALKLGLDDLLTKEQMKNIGGGTGCYLNNYCEGSGFCVGGNGITSPCICYVNGQYISSFACYNQ